MSAKSDQKTINKCMLQILNTFVEDDCRVKHIEPFYDTSSGFSITLVGRINYEPVKRVSIIENEEKRTFIFQVDPGFSKIYADDMFPEITFNYTYIGEITKSPKENKVLYECDRRACSGTCYKDCHYTPDITHAKNFECVDGLWFEHHSYPEEDLKSNCIGSCDVEFVKDPVKLTVKYDGKTYDVINKYESKSVRSFDLRETGNDIDPVNHPNHYEMVGPFESFDIIVESLGIYGARQFCQGNIIKYQTRYKDKNGEEDLKKRHWYDRMDQMLAKCKNIEDYYKLKEGDF